MQNITFDEKKLKVGIVTDQLLAGGVQLAAIEQVKELNRLGHNAKLLILMRKKYPTDFSYLVKGVPHEYLSDSYPPFFQKTIKFPVFSFLSTLHLMSPILAPRVLKVNDYDILISLGTTTCLTTQAIFRRLKIPYIAVIHDPIEYILQKAYSKTLLRYIFPIIKPLARVIEKSFVKDALDTIIISKVHHKYISQNYHTMPKILGFGTKILNKIPNKRGNTLLSFGRWQKEKNPEFLLDLAKSLPKIKLIIAGHWIISDELKQFTSKIKKYNLEQRVLLVPHYEDEELAELCAKSRVFIHPHFEAFGLAALEAAGQGLPIIIPEKSGVTEMFKHGVHGFFPIRLDTDEYSMYIKKLLAQERLAYKMGHDAWSLVKKKLSWEANVKQLLTIIYSSLSIQKKPTFMVTEISHALGAPLAGGDKLMEPMATRLRKDYGFSIIVSNVGAKHWKKAGFEKQLLVLPHNRFDESGKPHYVFTAYCIRMFQAYKSLKREMEKTAPDGQKQQSRILYSSTNILPDILPAYFTKQTYTQIPWIARVHHLIPPPHKREGRFLINAVSYGMQLLALFMLKTKADMVIVLNNQLKRDLQKKGFREEKIRVLGGGIEFDKITRLAPKEKIKFQGVFLGRLHVTKGIFDTIPIWKKVIDKIPNARLAIIGDGPSDIKIHLEEKIRESGLHANIKLLGFLPYEEVYTIMKQADIFLFLDHEAGWGLAVAEAMACGLPVVGYDNGVLGSVYKNGYLMASIGNYKETSSYIIKLIENTDIREDLAKKAYNEAAKHDWAITSKRFSHLLEDNVAI